MCEFPSTRFPISGSPCDGHHRSGHTGRPLLPGFAVTFLVLFLFILGLQVLHRRLLRELLGPAWSRVITWTLVLLHVPLAAYMALRLTGNAAHGLGPWLRPFMRLGLYFQALTVFNLLVQAIDHFFWRFHGRVPEPVDESRRAFLRRGAAVGMGVGAIGVGYGRWEANRETPITRLSLDFPDLPSAFDGVKLAHLSDLHSGPLVKAKQLQRWRKQVEREAPDLLLFTGDFVDSRPEEIVPLLEAFRDFPAPLGRFAVLGNHDYFTDPEPLWAGLQGIGVGCLENRHAVVERGGQRLAILGLQDPMARNGRFQGVRFGPGPQPYQAVQGLDPDTWRLALVHRPGDWELARLAGARLALAGHTHGGQINLIPGLSSARLLGPRTQGLFREGQDCLYVSRGLGTVGLPLRIGAPSELVILTLRRR